MTELSIGDALNNDPNEDSPLVPPGNYKLGYVSHEPRVINNAHKLEIRFRIIDQGPYFGKILSRYYNVQPLGKAKKGGRFKAGKKSLAARELINVIDFSRMDRIPLSNLRDCIVIGKVKTVTHGNDQQPIHEKLQYSVIGKILGKES